MKLHNNIEDKRKENFGFKFQLAEFCVEEELDPDMVVPHVLTEHQRLQAVKSCF